MVNINHQSKLSKPWLGKSFRSSLIKVGPLIEIVINYFYLLVACSSDPCIHSNSSRKDLEVNGVLEETCILDELDHFLLSMSLYGDLCQVLAEEVTALTAKQVP